MVDIVEQLRNARSREDSFMCNEAAKEIESLRAQLAEALTTKEAYRRKAGALCDQLLATQAHAARLREALANLNESARMCQAGEQDKDSIQPERTRAIEALSIPINLDALHEDRALECERLHDGFSPTEDYSGLVIRQVLEREADAHRAKKDGPQ